MPFSEQESITVKRLEVAIRNSDMELLKEASYKLHEKFHEGYRFEKLQELSQILAYVSESDIPSDIKEILCPTLVEILDKGTAPQQNEEPQNPFDEQATIPPYIQNQVSQSAELYPSDAYEPAYNPEPSINTTFETDSQNFSHGASYETNSSYQNQNIAQTPFLDVGEKEESIPETPLTQNEASYETHSEYNQAQNNEPQRNEAQNVHGGSNNGAGFENQNNQNTNTMHQNSEDSIKEDNNRVSEEKHFNNNEEQNKNEKSAADTYQEQFSSDQYSWNVNGLSSGRVLVGPTEEPSEADEEKKEEGSVAGETASDSDEAESQNEDDNKRLCVFYYDKKTVPLNSPTNQIDELSMVLDTIDVDIYDFEKMLHALKSRKGMSEIVTTSQSIKFSEFLVQDGISFTIPFVTNTVSENADMEIIPMYGLSNVFRCQRCGTKILSYSFNNKVLSVKCSNCANIMYPDIYAGDKTINPYYWQRAFGAFSGSKIWILLNLPGDDSVMKDFIETVYKNSSPEKIYMFPANNYYEDLFSKLNPNCEVITYQTQEKLISDFTYPSIQSQAVI